MITRAPASRRAFSSRRSGLQSDVLALYREALRLARRKEREAIQAAAVKSLGAFASIEYTPPNNEVYRAHLKAPTRANAYFPMCVFILVGVTVGLIGTGIASGLFSFEHRPRGLLVTTSGPTARSSLRLGFRMIERARGARCPLASQPQAKRDERAAPI